MRISETEGEGGLWVTGIRQGSDPRAFELMKLRPTSGEGRELMTVEGVR